MKTERITIAGVLVISQLLTSPLNAGVAAPANPTGNEKYNLSKGEKVKIPAKKAPLPLYVYGDETGNLAKYVASGYMGDSGALSLVTTIYDETAPASTGRTGKTSLRVKYEAKGREGWAGLYWLSPANNWARVRGGGYDLRNANKLTFWVRGENGGEKISQFKVGGVNGPYPDSDAVSIGPIRLTKDWQQYTIDLKGKDLRHIVGGFMFVIKRADNVRGATFFLDEVVFSGDAKRADVALEEELEVTEEQVNKDLASAPEQAAVALAEAVPEPSPLATQVKGVPMIEGMVQTDAKKNVSASKKSGSISQKPKKEVHIMRAPAYHPVPMAMGAQTRFLRVAGSNRGLFSPSAVKILESILWDRSRGRLKTNITYRLWHKATRTSLHWQFFPYVAYLGAR